MMLYLTGASSSLAKSGEAPQNDVSKSLGGYISSSLVPNGGINALFDMISLLTLKNKPKEVLGLGLINKFDYAVKNVELKIVTRKDYVGKFKIAVTSIGSDYAMEHIDNTYSEPIQAEFINIDFYRASIEGKIITPGVVDEIISIQPLDINITVIEGGIDGTMKSIFAALESDDRYGVRKLSNNRFELFSKDENVVLDPFPCSAISTENAELEFFGEYKNEKNNTALLAENFNPGEAFGIWIQREIVPMQYSNEELVKMSDDGVEFENREDVELVISYDLEESNE